MVSLMLYILYHSEFEANLDSMRHCQSKTDYFMPVISAGKLRHEDCQVFNASLGYIVRLSQKLKQANNEPKVEGENSLDTVLARRNEGLGFDPQNLQF